MSNNEVRRRAGSRELRKTLLGIVYELVSEHGIEGTGVRAVAEAGGISTGTINYHFGNKHNLLIQAFEAAYELPADWGEYKGSPTAQLKRLMMGYVFRTSSDRFWRFWINYTAQSTRDNDMRRRQAQRYAKQAEFWAQLVSDGIKEGILRPDLDCEQTANRLLLMAHGLVVRQILSPDPATREAARRFVEDELSAISILKK